jgi:hypothetical protein
MDKQDTEIEKLLKDRVSASAIGRMMRVDRKTVGRYIEQRLPQYSKKKKTN